MTTDKKRPRMMKTTAKSLRILELIREQGVVRPIDVAEHFDMNRGSAYTHLATLREFGYVTESDGEYRLGMPLVRLGETTRTRCTVTQLASSIVSDIADETGERVQFMMEEHGELWYLCGDHGERGVDTGVNIGTSVPIHASAAGKAVLAEVSDEKREEMIAKADFKGYNSNTITDYESLMEEIEQVQERGFAINQREITQWLNSIGVPITSSEADSVGALCIIGPAQRLTREKMESDLAEVLLSYANKLEIDAKREKEGSISPYGRNR